MTCVFCVHVSVCVQNLQADSGSWRTAGLGVLQSDTPNGGSGAATSQRTGHNVDSVSRRLERMAVDSSSSSGNHHRHHNHHSQRQQQQRRGHVADYQQHGQPAYLLPTPGANPRAPAMNTAGVRTRGFSSSPYVTNTGGYRNMPPQQQQQQQSLASFVNMMPAMGLYVSPSSSSSSLLGQPPMSSMPSHTGVAGPSGAFPNVQQQQQQGMHFSAAGAMNAASNASHPSYSRQGKSCSQLPIRFASVLTYLHIFSPAQPAAQSFSTQQRARKRTRSLLTGLCVLLFSFSLSFSHSVFSLSFFLISIRSWLSSSPAWTASDK